MIVGTNNSSSVPQRQTLENTNAPMKEVHMARRPPPIEQCIMVACPADKPHSMKKGGIVSEVLSALLTCQEQQRKKSISCPTIQQEQCKHGSVAPGYRCDRPLGVHTGQGENSTVHDE
jgi:hypothetical protein